MNRKWGRLLEFDVRSRSFPIRELLKVLKPRSYTWSCSITLDQGNTSACTGFSVAQEAAARPVVIPNITNNMAQTLYKRAKELDEWPGENYDGSSVLAAIKAGQEKGWYKEYRWAFSENDLSLAIGHYGPVVLGINWYEGMEDVDSDGLIQVAGNVLGGHAILCNGYNVKKKLYRLHNSWGKSWGINGECFITVNDLTRLLAEDGEACIPVVRSKQ